jgi:hypothetical protein
MTDSKAPSPNQFTRLFEGRAVEAAKAKPKLNPMRSPLAAAIAQATARATDEDVLEAEVIEATATIEPAAVPAAIAPAAEPIAEAVEPIAETSIAEAPPTETAPTETPPKAIPPGQLQPRPKTIARSDDAPRRGRGRPSGGKRSDPGWQSRTFYIRKGTDDRLERAILKLKHAGIELDKSQLADALLNAWAAVELGEFPDFPIGQMLEKPEPTADH